MSFPIPTEPNKASYDHEGKHLLLFASYCGDDNPNCSDAKPCPTCLGMSNVFRITEGKLVYDRELAPEWNDERYALTTQTAEEIIRLIRPRPGDPVRFKILSRAVSKIRRAFPKRKKGHE